MATVYVGYQTTGSSIRRPVAVKVLHEHLSRDADYKRRFLGEMRLIAHIDHPFVCRVFDHGQTHDGRPYFVMEYLLGEPVWRVLRAMVKRKGSLRPEVRVEMAARVIADLAEGLHAAHEACDDRGQPLKVIHRDISPQNLFVMYDGTVRLVDFGVARHEAAQCHTKTGAVMGKLAYMAPEQIQGESYDRRLDVWAMGVVFWELLAGQRLFRRATEMATLRAVCYDPIPSLVPMGIDAELDAIVMATLERDVHRRTASARELATSLYRYLAKRGSGFATSDVSECLNALLPGSRKERERWARPSHDLRQEDFFLDSPTRGPSQHYRQLLEDEARLWREGKTETELAVTPDGEPTRRRPMGPDSEDSITTRPPQSIDVAVDTGEAAPADALWGVDVASTTEESPKFDESETRRWEARPVAVDPWPTDSGERSPAPMAITKGVRTLPDRRRWARSPKSVYTSVAALAGLLVVGAVAISARSEESAATSPRAIVETSAHAASTSVPASLLQPPPPLHVESESELGLVTAKPGHDVSAASTASTVKAEQVGVAPNKPVPKTAPAQTAKKVAPSKVVAAQPEPSVEFGYAYVTTTGGKAKVFEQGAYLGTTPVRARLAAGSHTLLLVPVAGGAGTRVAATIQPGSTALVSAHIAVTRAASPAGAQELAVSE